MVDKFRALEIYSRIRSKLDNPNFYHCLGHEKEFGELKELWKEIFPENNEDIIVPSEGIEVFHTFRDRKSIEEALKNGLKTYNQLVAEGVVEPKSVGEEAVGPYRNCIVYFTFPINGAQRRLDEIDWVSVLVDPKRALVHNAHCRQYCPEKYFESVLTLADYVERLVQVVQARKEKPNHRFILDPLSAMPRSVFGVYENIYDVGYSYNEIGIPRQVHPSEFYRTSKDLKPKTPSII